MANDEMEIQTTEPVTEPAPEPTTEPVEEPTIEPAAEPTLEPAAGPTPEPTTEPEPEAEETPNELAETREKLGQALEMAMRAEAKAAAAGLGVRADRIAYAVKLADLSGIDLTQADASDRISAAIGKVLSDLPELKGAPGAGTGAEGAHVRQPVKADDPFTTGFKRG